MTFPRRHHVQPKVLLKQFANVRGLIGVVQKAGGQRRTDSIINVSVIKDANTLLVDDGKDFSVESMLSQVEGMFPNILLTLDAARTREEDAKILAMMCIQIGRNPANRARIKSDAEMIQYALRQALLEEDALAERAAVEAEIEHYAKTFMVKSHIGTSPENIAIAGTSWNILSTYKSLQPSFLSILRSNKGAFILGDTPISIRDSHEINGTSPKSNSGQFEADTEILFPITSRHVALLTKDKLEPVIDISSRKDLVAAINARTVRFARREIYCEPTYDEKTLEMDMSMWFWSQPLLPSLPRKKNEASPVKSATVLQPTIPVGDS